MQNFFFDRRSRKRNRRTDEEQPPVEQVPGDERRQRSDRRHAGRSTLEHYYAAHDMELDDFSDLESTPAGAKVAKPGKGSGDS